MENNIYVLRKNQIINKLKELSESGASEATKAYYHGQLSIIEELIEEREKIEKREKELDNIEITLDDMAGGVIHISKQSLLCKIATQIFGETTVNTTNSSRYIYLEDIENTLGLNHDFWNETTIDEVIDTVNYLYGEQVAEIYFDKDAFGVVLYHNYCVGIIEDDQAIKEYREY